MKSDSYKILLISGSLRKDSTNTGLLRAIEGLQDSRFDLSWAKTIDFPVFNQDIESVGIPLPVKNLREQVKKNDAIIFAVPEYNLSIASSFKNAYDWLSRQYPGDSCPVTQKIAAMVSSAGMVGGANAQRHFSESVKFRKMKLLHETLDQSKRIQVNRFQGKKFDEKGNLIDEQTKQKLKVFLDQFYKWIQINQEKK